MNKELTGIRSTVRRVGGRTVRALLDVVSNIGSRRFIGITKWPQSLREDRGELLPLRYSYRASPEGLINFTVLMAGLDLSLRLHAMSFTDDTRGAGDLVLACDLQAVERGDVLTVNVLEPSLSLNGSKLQPHETRRVTTRKFVSEIQQNVEGRRYSRLCTHYLPYDDKEIGRDYYFGDDYVDYGRTSAEGGLALLKRYAARGRLLDIGCALGIFTKRFLDAGLDVYGTDISEFAIDQAGLLVGPHRVRRADLDADDIPFDGYFDTIWMSDVIEHFSVPEAVLARVSSRVRKGALLFLHTSNGDSLTHRLLGKDWEGYSDYSHHGVDQVTCSSLRGWMDKFGWDIIHWECGTVWAEGLDPVLMRLKEIFGAITELRVFLEEMELGDSIQLVARKR
ncbi:MAG TPA: class I SAM-dependent methyltransferase [Pyrinomonadaceae bacterium]|jgi:2-polyprenyl-3-methyl-5-hydroxy-6-metoxy-1,4-benzoquinol methylase